MPGASILHYVWKKNRKIITKYCKMPRDDWKVKWVLPDFSSFLKTVLFHLVEKVSFRASEIHNFGTTVPILLLDCALLAVVGVGDARPATDDTPALHTVRDEFKKLE